MIEGSDVHWWGALGDTFENLTLGFEISDDKLNRTYKNSFVVHLRKNVTLDQIKVVSIWDKPTASDFGHVLLSDPRNYSNSSSPSLAPSPSVSNETNRSREGKRISEHPTMFDNYRLRWTLSPESNLIDIGLEATIQSQYYMAFGWADPTSSSGLMYHADVVVTGLTEEGMPFADDYFITKYSECLLSKDGTVQGVCPDTIYEGSDPVGLVNNTRLVYGHQRDGVSFIRYQRPLKSVDKKYDLPVNHTDNMIVIWALGSIRPPDTLRLYYFPQNHCGPSLVAYGHMVLNLSQHINDCVGPLVAEDKEDQDLIFANGKTPLVVTTGLAMHYPNPLIPQRYFMLIRKKLPC